MDGCLSPSSSPSSKRPLDIVELLPLHLSWCVPPTSLHTRDPDPWTCPFIVVVVVGEGAALKGNVPIVDLLLLLGHGGPNSKPLMSIPLKTFTHTPPVTAERDSLQEEWSPRRRRFGWCFLSESLFLFLLFLSSFRCHDLKKKKVHQQRRANNETGTLSPSLRSPRACLMRLCRLSSREFVDIFCLPLSFRP